MKRKTANIDIRVEPQLVERIDAWRARQRVLPSRSGAIVYMLEEFLEHDPPGLNAGWQRLLSQPSSGSSRKAQSDKSVKSRPHRDRQKFSPQNPQHGESKMYKPVLAALAVAVTVSGCAGRAPAPVSVVQMQDRYANCTAIMAEVNVNNQRISELGSEQGAKVAQNVVAGVAGLLIPILWFGMDFQGAAGTEQAALQARQQYLASLAEERCKGPEGPPSPIPNNVAQR